MKILMVILSSLFCFTVSAVDYPVKNIRYITEFDYREEVQESEQYVVLVFSSKECLERTIPDRNCWLFEKKLDYFVPSFSSKVKVVGLNTYFENYSLVSQFHLQKYPTIIILTDNYILDRFEPNFVLPDLNQNRLSWQDELLKKTVEAIYKIR